MKAIRMKGHTPVTMTNKKRLIGAPYIFTPGQITSVEDEDVAYLLEGNAAIFEAVDTLKKAESPAVSVEVDMVEPDIEAVENQPKRRRTRKAKDA